MASIILTSKVILTADNFIENLLSFQSETELEKIQRYFKSESGQHGETDEFIGIKMGVLFELAKLYAEMPIMEIEKLLESQIHEIRAGAVSIMDKASRAKNITEQRLGDFFDLYIRRHDRINNWDLVDLGCLNMTGRFLFGNDIDILYELAISDNLWKRRSAILSTCYFIRKGNLDETYKIAKILINDQEDLVNKATGWMLRFAGDKDKNRLVQFLNIHATILPRVLLRNCIEKFNKNERNYFLKLRQQ